MQNFLEFITDLLKIVCDFLMTEPICWFTAILVLLAIVALVNRICRL